MRFDRKVVLVTGGSRGIGKNIADLFSDRGARVARGDRKASQFNTDLSSPYAGRILINEVMKRYGQIDVLVNNARSMSLPEDEDSWDQEMAVNLKSAYFLGKYAIEEMNGGAIVNIGSITSNFTSKESAAYQISKGAVFQLTRVLAMKGSSKGVRVNAVLPGFVVKDEHRDRFERRDNLIYKWKVEGLHPLKTPGTPLEIAQAVAWLSSDESSFVNGASLTVDGGLTLRDLTSTL